MSYNFEVQGGKSYNIPVGGKYCPDNIVITATGGGVSLDVIAASFLPATVVENQIVVITDTTPGTIYVDTDEPANPVSGDVWVVVGASENGVQFSESFRNGLTAARQYSGGAWGGIKGYVGAYGKWEQFGIALPAIGTPLSDWTWQQIIDLANSSVDPKQYFAVGDKKSLDSLGLNVVIGDFYRNTITGTDKKAAISFTFENCYHTTYAMNTSNTNVGSWSGSYMRNSVMPTIFNFFPDELKAEGAIKYVDVVTTAGNQSSALQTTSDRLRLHSVQEMGLTSSLVGTEGSTYSYYAAGNRIKYLNGSASWYWTRSPILGNSERFCGINTGGSAGSIDMSTYKFGVACAFDI